MTVGTWTVMAVFDQAVVVAEPEGLEQVVASQPKIRTQPPAEPVPKRVPFKVMTPSASPGSYSLAASATAVGAVKEVIWGKI